MTNHKKTSILVIWALWISIGTWNSIYKSTKEFTNQYSRIFNICVVQNRSSKVIHTKFCSYTISIENIHTLNSTASHVALFLQTNKLTQDRNSQKRRMSTHIIANHIVHNATTLWIYLYWRWIGPKFSFWLTYL